MCRQCPAHCSALTPGRDNLGTGTEQKFGKATLPLGAGDNLFTSTKEGPAWVLSAENPQFSLNCSVLQFSSGKGRALLPRVQGQREGWAGGILQWAAALATQKVQIIQEELPHLTTREG